MRTLKVIFIFLTITTFFNCRQDVINNVSLADQDLIGYWESFESTNAFAGNEVQFMLDNHYCSAFELRSNKELAIYYRSGDRPSQDRIDGHWSLENGNELFFDSNGLTDTKVIIVEHIDSTIKMTEKDGVKTALRKQN